MKTNQWVVAMTLMLSLALSGCGKKGEPNASGGSDGSGGSLPSSAPAAISNSPGCEKAFAHFLDVHKKFHQWQIENIEKRDGDAKKKEELIKAIKLQLPELKKLEPTFMYYCNPSVRRRFTEADSAKFVACILAADSVQGIKDCNQRNKRN